MTSEIDLCNQALSASGARVQIASFEEGTQEAVQCALHYHTLRRQLLRSAPWGFARMQADLNQIAAAPDSRVPFPWLFTYSYPSSCMRLRYILQKPADIPNDVAPAVGDPINWSANCSPIRTNRFLLGTDQDSSGTSRRIIMSNVFRAVGVWTADVVLPDMMDDCFQQALVNALASKLIMPLTGNSGDQVRLEQLTSAAVMAARVADGQESTSSTDHTPDWILARGVSPYPGFMDSTLPGLWYVGWDSTEWGA